jgi:hypothetical protein
MMTSIGDVVKKALDTGFLSREAEDNLRRMLTTKYGDDELEAFISLQQAAMAGRVRQESREILSMSR